MKLVTAITRAVKTTDTRRVKRASHRIITMTRKAGLSEPLTATIRNRTVRITARSLNTTRSPRS